MARHIQNSGAMWFTAVMWVITTIYAAYLICIPLFFPEMTRGQLNNDVVFIVLPIVGIIGSFIGCILHIYFLLKRIEKKVIGTVGIASAVLHCLAYGYAMIGGLYA